MSYRIPDGWEFVRDGIPRKGEWIIPSPFSGKVCNCEPHQVSGNFKHLVCHIVKPICKEQNKCTEV